MDPRTLFSGLQNRELEATDLIHEIGRVRAANYASLPVEVGIDELIRFARQSGWLTTTSTGSVRIADPAPTF